MFKKKLELLYEQILQEQNKQKKSSVANFAARVGPMGIAQWAGDAYYNWLKKHSPEFDKDNLVRTTKNKIDSEEPETKQDLKQDLKQTVSPFKSIKVVYTTTPLKGFFKGQTVKDSELFKYDITLNNINDLKSGVFKGINIIDEEGDSVQVVSPDGKNLKINKATTKK